MTFFEVMGAIVAFYAILYVSAFAHELGHAMAGRAAGFVVTSFGLGTARPFCVVPVGGMRVYFALVQPFQGIAFVYMTQLFPSKGRVIFFTAGGILANGALALVSLGIWAIFGNIGWLVVAGVNGLLAVVSLMPFQVRIGKASMRTDGALILQVLRSGSIAAPSAMLIQTVEALRRFWLSIGDTLILRVYLLSAACAWSDLGDAERAELLYAEAETLQGPVPPALLASSAITGAAISLQTGRLDDLSRFLDTAESAWRSIGDEAGLFLIELYRAQEKIQRGDVNGASVELDALTSNPLAVHHPELGVSTLAVRLSAAIVEADEATVDRLRVQYDSVRRTSPSVSRDLRVYRAVARFRSARGDHAGAEPLYRQALASASEIAASFGDTAQLGGFQQTRTDLLADARQCFTALGKDDDAERLTLAVVDTIAAARLRDARFRRDGLWIMVLNLVCAALSSMVAVHSHSVACFTLAALLVVFTFLGGLLLAIDPILSRLFPGARRSVGARTLLLACLPWVAAVVVWILASIELPP